MYLSTARGTDAAAGRRRRLTRGAVSANVLALGLVSLLTDISAEMAAAVLPLYAMVHLGLSPLAFGLLDGINGGAGALVRLLGGHLADRRSHHKLIAGLGYALSAAAKPFLLLAFTAPAIAAVLTADRAGKGLRTAPRDALISLSTPPAHQGRAFAVHRAMDTTGAVLGPPAAFAILWLTADAYDAVFVVSACIAASALLVLAFFVRQPAITERTRPARHDADDRRLRGAPPPQRLRRRSRSDGGQLRATLGLLRIREVRRICVCAAVLGGVTISDAFMFLVVSRRIGLAPQWFPLLALGVAGTFLALVLPLGVLADRVGRWAVFAGGHAALLGAYVSLLSPVGGAGLVVAVLVLMGAFYAATDGVLMAAAGPLLPEELRAGGLALAQTGQAAGRFVCSLAFGAAWTYWGADVAVGCFTVALSLVFLLVRKAVARGQPAATS